jgi:hypothetical protein
MGIAPRALAMAAMPLALPRDLLQQAQAIAVVGFDHWAGFHHEPRALGVEPAVRP